MQETYTRDMGVSLRKKVFVSFSKAGWVFIVLTIVLGFAAVNSGNNVLFLIVSAMLAFMLISGLVSLYNLRGIEVTGIDPGVLTVGEQAWLEVTVKNCKKSPSFLLEIRSETSKDMLVTLASQQSSSVWTSWTPSVRGEMAWPSVTLGSAFPFGFIWRGWTKQIGQKLIIAPAQRYFEQKFFDHEEQNSEEELIAFEGYGEWVGIRQQKTGEKIGNVVWKRVDWQRRELEQKAQPLPAHQFSAEQTLPVVIDWFDPSLEAFSTERRLRVLRYLLEQAVQQNCAWVLNLSDQTLHGNAMYGREDALRCLALHKPLPVYDHNA